MFHPMVLMEQGNFALVFKVVGKIFKGYSIDTVLVGE